MAPFQILAASGIRHLVIGANALVAHGVQRHTSDVDCAIATPDDAEMKRMLAEGGYREVFRQDQFARYQSEDFRLPELDVMLLSPEVFEKLWAERVPFKRLGTPLHAPSVLHLVALKLHAIRNNPGRLGQDLEDVVQLLRSNPGKTVDGLQETCERYGPPGIYDTIRQRFLS